MLYEQFSITQENNQFQKKLLNNLDMEKDKGVEIRLKNLPGTPQCENDDFFNNLIILATSIGLVLRTSRLFIPPHWFKYRGKIIKVLHC